MPGFGRNAADNPTGYLRHQWLLGAWRKASWGERVLFVLAGLLWYPTTVAFAGYLALRLGPGRKRIYGKSLARQFIEQIAVAARWMIPPLWYYTFELMDDAKRARAGDYLQRVQMKPFIYHWLVDRVNRKDKRFPFANKPYFSELCKQNGLPASTVIAVISATRASYAEAGVTELPPVDLFVKIKNGRGGRGAEKWSYAAGLYRDAKGQALTAPQLIEHLKSKSRFEKRIIQPCLVNHSALADLNLGALSTVRVLTVRNEQGEIEATHAVIRMPQYEGAPVDNIHAGGIAAAIDLATGRMGRATDLGVRPDSAWHEKHPLTGAPILGRCLPHWQAVLDLARRAHAVIGDRIVVGWDVAILEDGPCLVEGNGKPDVDLIQRPHGAGLGNSRFGALVAHHLKNHRAGDTRNGRPMARPEAAARPAAVNSAG
jgi:hypothetical protein